MSRICIVGTGYVGTVTGACFAELGHRVTCVDIDKAKVLALSRGITPIFEPGLDQLVQRNMQANRLCVTTSFHEAVKGAEFIFMCVGTPMTPDNQIDLSFLHLAYMRTHAALADNCPIFVNKSTVPPGTSSMMEKVMSRLMNGRGSPSVVSNPEFLSEGHAVADFMHPSRVVVGARDVEAAELVAGLYRGLECPFLITDAATAELVKYASNAFLATKISFINEIAALCVKVGVDVGKVAEGMGLDPRIGKEFLKAGVGYGGSCLPKDTAALAQILRACGGEARLLTAVNAVNSQQPLQLVQRVKEALGTLAGSRVAVLGLAFKPDTDDVRCSPAVTIIQALLSEGAEVRVCDPIAWPKATSLGYGVAGVSDPYQAASGCDTVILATEWAQFKSLDLTRLKQVMRGNMLVDGRNVFDPARAKEAGFQYLGVGRPAQAANLHRAVNGAVAIAD